jgi:hypothetical protein
MRAAEFEALGPESPDGIRIITVPPSRCKIIHEDEIACDASPIKFELKTAAVQIDPERTLTEHGIGRPRLVTVD